MTTLNLAPKLARRFHFSSDDLDYNEQGRLSPAQFQRLRRQSGSNFLFGALVMIVMLLALTLPLWAESVGIEQNINVDLDKNYLIFLSVSLLFICVFIYFGFRSWRQMHKLVQTEDAKRVETYIDNIILTSRGEDDPNILQIADAEFSITDRQMKILDNGEIYRIYYAPAFSKVVAIIPMSENKNTQKLLTESLRRRYQIPANVPIRAAQLWRFKGDDIKANRLGEFGKFQLQPNRLFNTKNIDQQTIQVVEGKVKIRKGEQNFMIAKIPTLELEIEGIMVKTFSRFAHLLEESFSPDEIYRLYYIYDPKTRSNRPLSIEAIS